MSQPNPDKSSAEMRCELEQLQKDYNVLLHVVSHDLQSPVREVSGFAELLRSYHSDALPEEAKEFLGYILDGTQRLRSMLGALLKLSREGRLPPYQPTSFPVQVLWESVVDELKELIEQKGAVLSCESVPMMYGNQASIRTLFLHLLSNALVFCKESPRIEVTMEQKDGTSCIAIKDNGIGIHEKNFERIFKPFQRLHVQDEYPGLGVGLTLCRKIVECHGGTMWVESTPDRGSTFFVTLPEPSCEEMG